MLFMTTRVFFRIAQQRAAQQVCPMRNPSRNPCGVLLRVDVFATMRRSAASVVAPSGTVPLYCAFWVVGFGGGRAARRPFNSGSRASQRGRGDAVLLVLRVLRDCGVNSLLRCPMADGGCVACLLLFAWWCMILLRCCDDGRATLQNYYQTDWQTL